MNTRLLEKIVYLSHCELIIDINMKNGNFIAAAMVLELLRNSHDAGWKVTLISPSAPTFSRLTVPATPTSPASS